MPPLNISPPPPRLAGLFTFSQGKTGSLLPHSLQFSLLPYIVLPTPALPGAHAQLRGPGVSRGNTFLLRNDLTPDSSGHPKMLLERQGHDELNKP